MNNKYEDLIIAMRKKTKQISKSKVQVINFLYQAGICNKQGEIKDKFR